MYKYDIPVFHIYEEFLFKHRVDFDALERGLEKYKDGFDVSKWATNIPGLYLIEDS